MDAAGQDIALDMPAIGQPPSRAPVVAVRRRGEWDRPTFLQNIRMLNKMQKLVVLTVIDGIRLRSPARRIYIDGTAGTGKSVVARCIANAFETFAPNNHPGCPKCATSAPTGKAAHNVDGVTMHSTYVLPFNQEATAANKARQRHERDGESEFGEILDRLDAQRLATLQNNFCDMCGHLIDEISMVSQRTLLSVDQRCREAMNRFDVPFGGLWTIVFGDFRQLPPVCGRSLLEESDVSLAGSFPLWSTFDYVELTENMRQGEDKAFADVLRKIGNYEELDSDERKIIESRFILKNNLIVPDNAVRLYYANKDVEKYTKAKLEATPSETLFILDARDRVEENKNFIQTGSSSARRKAQARADVFLMKAKNLLTSKARGLPSSLIAVPGLPYMLTSNIDTPDGLVNGAVGELVWIEFGTLQRSRSDDDGEEKVAVKRLWLRFPGTTGRERAARYRHELRQAVAAAPQYMERVWPKEPPPPPTENEMDGLVPIEREDVVLNNVVTEPWRHVKRQQFPLVSALAMTIHKVQGTTKDCILTIYSPTWPNDLVYVALSRVTKLSGLFIDDSKVTPGKDGWLFQHPPRVEDLETETLKAKDRLRLQAVRDHVTRLEAERDRLSCRRLVPRWQGILDAPPTQPRAVYLNVQSLLAHQEDVRLDEVLMAADFLLVAETWMQPADQVSLGDHWQLAARCDRTGDRRGGGVAIYSKKQCKEVPCPAHPDIEMAGVLVGPSLRLAVMYCHGKPEAESVLDAARALLPSAPGTVTILCGDFNIDMMGSKPSAQSKQLVAGLAALGVYMNNSADESTTYDSEGTVIDAVFSNASRLQVDRYQAYYSHHLPLVISLP